MYGRLLSSSISSGLQICCNGKLTQFRGVQTHRFSFSSTRAV